MFVYIYIYIYIYISVCTSVKKQTSEWWSLQHGIVVRPVEKETRVENEHTFFSFLLSFCFYIF